MSFGQSWNLAVGHGPIIATWDESVIVPEAGTVGRPWRCNVLE